MKQKILLKTRLLSNFICVFLLALSIFLIAVIHFDNENENNTYSFISKIANVQYHSLGGAKGSYITFNANDDSYYIDCSREEYDSIRSIEQHKTDVEIIVTKEKEYLRYLWLFDFEQVVEIKDSNNVHISIQKHNQDQSLFRIVLIIVAFIIMCFDVIILFVHIICSTKIYKRK